jgi:phage terminase small subunit
MPSELTTEATDGLTELQASFVQRYVTLGNRNGAQAAREAGYAPDSAAKRAWELLQREDVLAAIHSLTIKQMAAAAPVALRTMVDLLESKSGFVRQKAAADILDRTGFKPPERHQHLVAGQVTISIDLGE